MSSNAALPHIVLVSEKFMDLNNKVRGKYHYGTEKEWRALAEDLYQEIRMIMNNEPIDGNQIKDMSRHELLSGHITNPRKLRHAYIIGHNTYGQKGAYREFNYREIQSRLACWTCLNEWMELYESGDYSWEMKGKPGSPDFGFISGNSKKFANACHIKLYIGDYAGHLDKEAGGYRCNKSGNPKHPVDSGLKLTVVNDNYSFEKMWLFNDILPGYRDIDTYSQKISDISLDPHASSSSAFTRLNSIIKQDDMDKIRKKHIQNSFAEIFSSRDYVILQAIVRYKHHDTTNIIFKMIKNQNKLKIKYSDFSANNLGLFLFTKEEILSDVNEEIENPYFIAAAKKYQQSVSKEISKSLGWESEGQLFKFNHQAFFNEDGRAVEIDYDSKRSTFIDRYKSLAKQRLPIISTSIKGMHFYHYNGEGLTNVNPESRFRVKNPGDKILVKTFGYKSPKVEFIVKREGNDTYTLFKQTLELESNFFCFTIPQDKHRNRNLEYTIRVEGQGKVSGTETFFIENIYRSQESTIKDIKLDDSIESNKEILISNIRYQFEKKYGVSSSEFSEYYQKSNGELYYTEIMKKIIKQNTVHNLENTVHKYGTFSLPTNLISINFPGLEELVFSEESQASIAGRLRSTGIYYPAETNDLDSYDMPSRKWSSWRPHIVPLDENWYLLLTPNPLNEHRFKPDDKNIIVTNHGTFLRDFSHEKIQQIPGVEVRDKPMFLDHIAQSPEEHMNFVNYLLDSQIPDEKTRLAKDLSRYYYPELTFNASTIDKIRYWEGVYDFNTKNWDKCESEYITELPLSKYCLKTTLVDGSIVCFDILILKRKNQDDEGRLLILRRVHDNGIKDYLVLGNAIREHDKLKQYLPEWIAAIKLDMYQDEQGQLKDFLDWTSAKYDSPTAFRAFDWRFIAVETLRSFVAINNKYSGIQYLNDIDPFRIEISGTLPEPLRKYLLGGGKFDFDKKRNTDNMGGALGQPILTKHPSLSAAFLSSIARWIWLERSD